jgi:hypothetical protein
MREIGAGLRICAAGSTRSAAEMWQLQRQAGSEPPLCDSSQLQRMDGSLPPEKTKDIEPQRSQREDKIITP